MSVYSSRVLKDFYGTEEIRRVFSDEARIGKFRVIEVALAKVEEALGVIPAGSHAAIARGAEVLVVDWDRLKRDTETIGYPVLPYLRQLAEHCGEAGQYIHWGSTTRDITDTATALQLGEALAIIARELSGVRETLVALTRRHRDTLMIARTHGMHALPTTFGFRTAIWLSEVDRQVRRLDQVRETVRIGQFGGAVGTLAALEDTGLAVQRALMQELGLQAPSISWFASRDRISELAGVLAQIAGTMASIAKTIVVMTRDEVREVREPDVPGRGTSSAMPHKHNTVGSELVLVYARMAAQLVPVAMDAMVQDYDRDWQGHFETLAIPQSCLVTHAAVKQMKFILDGLIVYPERMRRNIDVTRGLVMAESVMMVLAKKIGRTQSHKLVTEVANVAAERDVTLREALLGDARITAQLGVSEIDHALDPANYLGCTGRIIDQVLAEVG